MKSEFLGKPVQNMKILNVSAWSSSVTWINIRPLYIVLWSSFVSSESAFLGGMIHQDFLQISFSNWPQEQLTNDTIDSSSL